MKTYIITDRPFAAIKDLAFASLNTDHFVGGADGDVRAEVEDTETLFDDLGYVPEVPA